MLESRRMLEALNKDELLLLRKLATPEKIQRYLDELPYNKERDGETCRSPRVAIQHNTAHCFEGALLAAAALRVNGRQPLILDLESVRDDLTRTEHQPQDYLSAHEARTRLAAELSGLEEAVTEVSRKIEHYAQRVKARPYMERRNRIEARLKELPGVDSFPEGGVERLDLL